MKVFLSEINEIGTDLEVDQDASWVSEAVFRVDEKQEGRSVSRPRPISVKLNLRKVDEVVVISGKIRASVELVCSRCANPYSFGVEPSFSALFCKDPVMAGIAHLQQDKPVGQNHGWARHAHDTEGEGAPNQDLDITYISHDYIELGEVVTEQLQLQIPFQPLCNESCQGVCSQCGADLNAGRCACAKIMRQKPFSVLKDFKL